MLYLITLLILAFSWQKMPDTLKTPACIKENHRVDTPAKFSHLVWHDEFNYTGLPDSSKWAFDTGGSGFGNHELQFYTNARKKNAWVSGGKLTITARKEDWKSNHYTSAKLITKDKAAWKYGKIEVRAKLPKGRGTWPAIWMLPDIDHLQWPDDGEIDIMENVGFDQGNIHGTIHTKSYNHILGTQKGDTIRIPDCSDQYHVYAISWTSEEINFFVDDRKYFTFKNEHKSKAEWPFDNKFYLILNIAIGGDWGGKEGVDPHIFPAKMDIDYVRVYQ